jgi:type III secretion protein D
MRPSVITAITAATACISAVAIVNWPQGKVVDSGPTAAESAGAPAQPAQPDPAQRLAIENALKQAGFENRVRLSASDGRWVVRGYALGERDAMTLSAALARLEPRPPLRLTSEQDLRDEVADAIDRLAPSSSPSSVSPKYVGSLRMRLEGRMASAAEKDKLLKALSDDFPFVAGWDDAIATADGDAKGLVEDLRSRGWDVDGAMNAGTMELQVQLLERDVPKWEQSLQAATQGGAVPFRASMTFVQAKPEPRAPSDARLPFDVRSVVGGDMPYVLLQDGEKLARGGVRQGWRLAGISGTQVVFENNGRRAVLQR